MKLINKINQRYLVFSALIMIFLGLGIIISVRLIINEETDEKLEHTGKTIAQQIEKENKLISLEPYISVKTINYKDDSKYFSDTVFFDGDKEGEKFRELILVENIHNKTYQIVIRESVVESDDLIEGISLVILVALVLLLLSLFLINRKISKSVWSTFYINLKKLKHFSLIELTPFEPEKSSILEFKELNEVIKTLTEKVIHDYGVLKQFSEDASHELQTPLAVIRAKIESLLNGNQLNSVQSEKIQAISNSVNKLSRINNGLLLLTKIDNNQFTQFELLSIHQMIIEKIEYFKELAELKGKEINYSCKSEWNIQGNKNLLDILINNLLSNAINYGGSSGKIDIDLEYNKLIIKNPGDEAIINRFKMFERFNKESDSGSVGLGLAISKHICNVHKLFIEYSFEKGAHVFTVHEKL